MGVHFDGRVHYARSNGYFRKWLGQTATLEQAIMLEKMEKGFDPEEVIEEFEALTKDAKRVQVETLKRILKENSEAEYLKKWGLDGKTDTESYSTCVPLVTHKDLEPLIQQIADGSCYSHMAKIIFTL
ncbi:putative GH3 family protein [Helianthus debilis subsp. tardiflorus]